LHRGFTIREILKVTWQCGTTRKKWSTGGALPEFEGRKVPKAEVLTVDPSGFGVLICMRSVNEFRDIAKPDFPRSEGEITEELLWVVRTPERSWKSSLTLRARDKEGPGESGLDREGRDFTSEWYQSGKSFLSEAERRRYHATQKREAVT
jgi:hypothetical protein